MDNNQSQFRPAQRVRHSPRLLNGDTAGAPDPYATSPYGGPFDTEPDLEVGPSADQMYSYLVAPTGTRTFEQHDYPTYDSSYSYQNQSLWDALAAVSYTGNWTSTAEQQEVQSMEIDPQPLPSAPPIVRSDIPTFLMDQQSILDKSLMVAPNTPYTHNEPGMSFFNNTPDPNHAAEENAYFQTDNMNWSTIDNSALAMEQMDHRVQLNTNQPSLDDDLSSLFQSPGDPPPLEFGGSYIYSTAGSIRPSVRCPKLETRAASPPKPARRSRQKTHAYESILHLDLAVRNSSRSASNATSQRRSKAQEACVSCRISKKRCVMVDGRCGGCRPKQRCRSTEYLLPICTLPEIYTETKLDLSYQFDPALHPPRIYRASINVSFGSGKLGVPLKCKVCVTSSTSDNPPHSSMIWKNLRNPNTDKNCVQIGRLASCFIPSTCMPSAKTLLEWAVDSVQQLPSGVVEDFFGPLYTFATNYLRVGSRPLYDLMALTLVHTAIYNVCHSEMTIVFDKRQRARISLPLRLRVQICTSLFQLFNVTGAKIRQCIMKASRGPPKETRLAFCVVNLLLLLTYEHCLDETSKEIPFESDDAESGLAKRKKYFEAIVQDLRDLQRALFRNGQDFDHPIFDASWQGYEYGDYIDDLDLKAALSTLRIAMHEHQAPKISAGTVLVQTLAPRLYPEIAIKNCGHATISVAETVSTSKKVDFDNMTADTGLGNEDGSEVLSRPQAIEHVLQNLKKRINGNGNI